MMREGNTDKVLNYLSSNLHYLKCVKSPPTRPPSQNHLLIPFSPPSFCTPPRLKIYSLSHYRDKTSSLDGNIQAKNIRAYAAYLEEKVIAYRELKHDMVKMKQELIPKFKTASYQNGGTLLSDVESLQKQLNALLGCTVRQERENIVDAIRWGITQPSLLASFTLKKSIMS